jgi:hypothetical protein
MLSFNSKRKYPSIKTNTQNFIHPVTIPPPQIAIKTITAKGRKYKFNNSTLNKKSQNTKFYKVQPILFDDEIFEQVDNDEKVNLSFSWVMGYIKPQKDKVCDPKKIHLWSKKIRSQAEITTKHIDIVRQSAKLNNNKINELLYSGEMRIFKEIMQNDTIKYTILLNFSSGSFMANISEQLMKYKKDIEECVHLVIDRIKQNRNIDLFIIDDEKSFIKETNFTKSNIDKYFNELSSEGIQFLNNTNNISKTFSKTSLKNMFNFNTDEINKGGKKRTKKIK